MVHVDEITHNDPAEVTQAELSSNFFGSLEVGCECGFLVASSLLLPAVYIDRDKSFGRLDNQRTT